MIPQLASIGHLVQFGDAHTVLVGRYVLGNDVHSHLAEVEVGADARRGSDTRLAQYMSNHTSCQLVCCHLVCSQIVGHIHKDFIDRIDMNVLGRHILHVDAVNTGTIVDVIGHTGRCHMIGDSQRRIGFQLIVVGRLAGELSVGSSAAAFVVHLPHPLHHLEQTRTSRQPVLLQRRGHRQADGLLRAAGISHYQIGSQRVKTTLDTLHRGVERLEVDSDVCAVGWHGTKR